jgi:hypothetical protein
MSTYSVIRYDIADGDLIAVKCPKTFIQKLITWATQSNYFHVGIAVWSNDRLLVAQMSTSGDNLVPLSQYANFDVYKCPVYSGLVTDKIWQILGTFQPYNFKDAILAGINIRFNTNIGTPVASSMICSELVKVVYKECGWYPDFAGIPTPGYVSSKLTLKYSVTE